MCIRDRDKSSGPAGGSSGAFRTSRAAYADINRQLGDVYKRQVHTLVTGQRRAAEVEEKSPGRVGEELVIVTALGSELRLSLIHICLAVPQCRYLTYSHAFFVWYLSEPKEKRYGNEIDK